MQKKKSVLALVSSVQFSSVQFRVGRGRSVGSGVEWSGGKEEEEGGDRDRLTYVFTRGWHGEVLCFLRGCCLCVCLFGLLVSGWRAAEEILTVCQGCSIKLHIPVIVCTAIEFICTYIFSIAEPTIKLT